MSTPPIKIVADKAPPGQPTADTPGRIRPVSMPASLGAANATQPRKKLSLADALAKQRERRQKERALQQSFADDKGITFEEAGDALKKAREFNAAEKKQKEAEEAMKMQQKLETERLAAEIKENERREARMQEKREAEEMAKQAVEADQLLNKLETERLERQKAASEKPEVEKWEVQRRLVERSKNEPLEDQKFDEQRDTVKSKAQKKRHQEKKKRQAAKRRAGDKKSAVEITLDSEDERQQPDLESEVDLEPALHAVNNNKGIMKKPSRVPSVTKTVTFDPSIVLDPEKNMFFHPKKVLEISTTTKAHTDKAHKLQIANAMTNNLDNDATNNEIIDQASAMSKSPTKAPHTPDKSGGPSRNKKPSPAEIVSPEPVKTTPASQRRRGPNGRFLPNEKIDKKESTKTPPTTPTAGKAKPAKGARREPVPGSTARLVNLPLARPTVELRDWIPSAPELAVNLWNTARDGGNLEEQLEELPEAAGDGRLFLTYRCILANEVVQSCWPWARRFSTRPRRKPKPSSRTARRRRGES
jgi:hypothetical protein